MPIYQYKCQQCGANIEKMQAMASAPLVDCPECQQPKLKKVLTSAGIIFKGSGWYINDSKKSSSSTVSSTSSTESDKAASSSSTETKTTEAAATPPTTPTPTKSET